MKNILVFLLSLCMMGHLQAQSYIPFPTSNTAWEQATQFVWGINSPPPSYRHFKLNGDSLINGKLYSIISTDYNPVYAFIREQGKKVYCKYASNVSTDTTEFALYDFNPSFAGDQMTIYQDQMPQTVFVDDIDSVLIGNVYHRRLWVQAWTHLQFVEGVGTLQGLFYNETPWVDWSSDLSCFSQGNTIYSVDGTNTQTYANCWQGAFAPHKGFVFIDNNENGLFEASIDAPYANAFIRQSDGYATRTNADGIVTFMARDTSYLQLTVPPYFHLTSDSVRYHLFYHPNDTLKFGIAPDTLFEAFSVMMTPVRGSCDAVTNNFITVQNKGTLPLNAVNLSFQADTLYSFVQAQIAPTSIQGHTYNWTLNHVLTAGESYSFYLEQHTPSSQHLGDSMHFVLSGSYNNLVDTFKYSNIVRCSYDPNDKTAIPQGEYRDDYTLMGTPLDYVIRFQNTGNAPAQDIFIRDTLSAYLNPATLQVIGQSHPMRIEQQGRVVKIAFDNIMLPDSVHNEPNSHGFVRFRIRPYPTVTPNTEVSNTALIFFDANPVVITNTTHTYYVSILPPLSVSAPNTSFNNLSLYPTPSQNLVYLQCAQSDDYTWTLSDLLGKTLQVGSFKGEQSSLSRGNLPAGIYFITLSNGVSRWTKKVLFTD